MAAAPSCLSAHLSDKLTATAHSKKSRPDLMPTIRDIRSTLWQWTGPVTPLAANACTTPNDLTADRGGDLAPFTFLGWLIVEIECSDGSVGIGNAALSPHATNLVIDQYLRPMLIGRDPFDTEFLWQSMYRRTLPYGRKGI